MQRFQTLDEPWPLILLPFISDILSLNYLPCYKGCHREQGGSQVVPDDPVVLYEAQNITAQKIWSSSSFSTSHIPSFNSLLAAVLYHCLNVSSPNLFTPLPYVSLHDPVLLGMVVQSTSASLSLRNTPCFLKQICYEGQYFVWLFPFPDQSFQLFIHLHNTICIKCQQHVMEKSIKNTVQSWPPVKLSIPITGCFVTVCILVNKVRLKSRILSLPQLSGNTKFPHLCTRGREQPTGWGVSFTWAVQLAPRLWGWKAAMSPTASFRRGWSPLVECRRTQFFIAPGTKQGCKEKYKQAGRN